MADCPFCAIVDGDASAGVVHEDDRVVAFLDHRPATTGHVLVVPREHAEGLAALSETDGERIFAVGMRIAAALRGTGFGEGVNFLLADGEVAGQEVPHVHLHVIPRTEGDGVRFEANDDDADTEELDAVAERLRDVL